MDLWDTHGAFTHIVAAWTALALFCSTKIIAAARSRLHIFLGDAGHRKRSCRWNLGAIHWFMEAFFHMKKSQRIWRTNIKQIRGSISALPIATKYSKIMCVCAWIENLIFPCKTQISRSSWSFLSTHIQPPIWPSSAWSTPSAATTSRTARLAESTAPSMKPMHLLKGWTFGNCFLQRRCRHHQVPGEPKTFIFGGLWPIYWGPKTFIFHGFGVQRWFVSSFDASEKKPHRWYDMHYVWAFSILRDGSDLQVWCRLVLF